MRELINFGYVVTSVSSLFKPNSSLLYKNVPSDVAIFLNSFLCENSIFSIPCTELNMVFIVVKPDARYMDNHLGTKTMFKRGCQTYSITINNVKMVFISSNLFDTYESEIRINGLAELFVHVLESVYEYLNEVNNSSTVFFPYNKQSQFFSNIILSSFMMSCVVEIDKILGIHEELLEATTIALYTVGKHIFYKDKIIVYGFIAATAKNFFKFRDLLNDDGLLNGRKLSIFESMTYLIGKYGILNYINEFEFIDFVQVYKENQLDDRDEEDDIND